MNGVPLVTSSQEIIPCISTKKSKFFVLLGLMLFLVRTAYEEELGLFLINAFSPVLVMRDEKQISRLNRKMFS